MCLSLLEMALLLLPPLLLAIALTIRQRLPKDRRICIGRTRGDEETLVESSNDRKLALHIGCTPNAMEYPRCCLPVISLLCTALAHTCIQSLTRKPHFPQPRLNSLQPTSECGLVSTRVQLRFNEREFSADTRNLSWTRLQPGFKLQCRRAFSELTAWKKKLRYRDAKLSDRSPIYTTQQSRLNPDQGNLD